MYYFVENEKLYFPPVTKANEDGILAVGGDLSTARLLLAYRSGIFPWFSKGEPIIWWSPDPRFILYPENLKVSKSMRQILKKNTFEVTFDQNFKEVITHCGNVKRKGQTDTWITPEMISAYCELHQKGYAHSVEVKLEGKLVGGLYGLSLGNCFFGESMFSHVSNASKVGFITLVEKLKIKGFQMIDCQVHTEHLESLGAILIDRKLYMNQLKEILKADTLQGNWEELL